MLNRYKKILLFFGDLLVLFLALYLTLVLRNRDLPTPEIWELHFWPFLLLFGVWILVFYITGLLEISATKNDFAFYNKILRNLLINYIVGAAYFYFLTDKLFDIKPRGTYFLFIAINTLIFSLWRYGFNSLVGRPRFLKNVLLIGLNDEAQELISEIIRKPQLGYRIAGILYENQLFRPVLPGVEIYDITANLKKIMKEKKINTIVTCQDPRQSPELLRKLFESLSLRLQFFDLPTFYETLTGKIPITTIGHIWFLENLNEGEKGFYEALKRFLDVIFATVVLLITLPFFPMIALLIKLDSQGTVFFRQLRIGYLGKPFEAIKFRSMVLGAEKNGEALWAQKNDSRVTRFGKFMRRMRIDEFPQFLNVFKGEMTVVGPRPERPEFVRNLQRDIPFYSERHLVKPGLTGWAQINFQYGASLRDAFKKLQYDLFYIKNRSLPLDIGIILKTINIILSGKGQ